MSVNKEKNIVALTSQNKNIILWDINKNKKIKVLKVGAVTSLALSSDGKFLAYTGIKTSHLVDIKSEKKYLLGKDNVWHQTIQISPDNRWVAFLSFDNSIRIWNVKKREESQVLEGHPNLADTLAFSQDSKKLISSDVSQVTILWDIDYGIPIRRFSGLCATFDQKDERIAFYDSDLLIEPLTKPVNVKYEKIPRWAKKIIPTKKYKHLKKGSYFDFRHDLLGNIIEQAIEKQPLEICRYLFELKPTDNLSWEIDDEIHKK